jgi:hypothetical protein
MKSIYRVSHERNVWQIAAGDRNRTYSDCFLKWGVGLIGGDSEKTHVKSFKNNVDEGDIFLLRDGACGISAVGLVVSDYKRLEQLFRDVNGWSLPDARRVKWLEFPRLLKLRSFRFGKSPSRFSRVKDVTLIRSAKKRIESKLRTLASKPLPKLPTRQLRLTPVPKRLRKTVEIAKHLSPLFWEDIDYRPTEDELIAHLVVPFLRALGWRPELIAVKWRNIDVAVFNKLPRIPENCRFVIEAKRLGHGIEGALKQASRYLLRHGARANVILTDGVRYKLYSRRGGLEYANSTDLKEREYANLANLTARAAKLFARMRR